MSVIPRGAFILTFEIFPKHKTIQFNIECWPRFKQVFMTSPKGIITIGKGAINHFLVVLLNEFL